MIIFCEFAHIITPFINCISFEAKRSNQAWSDWDERELIKLKSLGTLTWNRIGESLGRTGAACQLHWKTMKNMNTIKSHIEYIKVFSDNNDKNYQITKESLLAIHNKYVNSNYYHHHSNQRTKGNFDDDIDIDLLKTVDNVLKTNQWRCSMLDVLWKNVVKELEKDKTKERERQQSIHLSTSTSTALSTSSSPPSPSSPSSSPSSPSSSSSCSPKSGSKIKTESVSASIENNNPNIWKTQNDVIKCIDNPPNTHTVSKIKPKKLKKQKKTKEKKKKKHKKKKQCKKNKVANTNEINVENESNNNNNNSNNNNDNNNNNNNNGNNTLNEDDKKYRSSRSNARWTKQEEDTLIKMLAQPSYSIEDIAKELGRSTNAISQHRLAMKHKHAKLRQSLFVYNL